MSKRIEPHRGEVSSLLRKRAAPVAGGARVSLANGAPAGSRGCRAADRFGYMAETASDIPSAPKMVTRQTNFKLAGDSGIGSTSLSLDITHAGPWLRILSNVITPAMAGVRVRLPLSGGNPRKAPSAGKNHFGRPTGSVFIHGRDGRPADDVKVEVGLTGHLPGIVSNIAA